MRQATPLTDITSEDAMSQALWRIPPLPGALARLLQVVNDETSDMEEIAELVSLDEVLASHVLRVANSAALGFRVPVTTIDQAVARIGCTTVCSVVVGKGVSQGTQLKREVGGIPRLEYWRHSWATAAAARILSPAFGISRGEAHLAGLLHDVGKLVLATYKPEEYETCVTRANTVGVWLCDAERLILGADHATVGATALQAWGLPETAVQAARGHHRKMKDTLVSPVVELVWVANAVAHQSGIGTSGEPNFVTAADCVKMGSRITEATAANCLRQLEAESAYLHELAAQFVES